MRNNENPATPSGVFPNYTTIIAIILVPFQGLAIYQQTWILRACVLVNSKG